METEKFEALALVEIAEKLTVLYVRYTKNLRRIGEVDTVKSALDTVRALLPLKHQHLLEALASDLDYIAPAPRPLTRTKRIPRAAHIQHLWTYEHWRSLRLVCATETPDLRPATRHYLLYKTWAGMGFHTAANEFLNEARALEPSLTDDTVFDPRAGRLEAGKEPTVLVKLTGGPPRPTTRCQDPSPE